MKTVQLGKSYVNLRTGEKQETQKMSRNCKIRLRDFDTFLLIAELI